jgi:hypothetical protein
MTNQLNTISLADLSSVTGGVAVRNVGVVNESVVSGVSPVGVGSVDRVVGVGSVPRVGVGVGNVNVGKPDVGSVGVVGPRVVQ